MRYRLATYRECKAHREWNTTCPDCGRRGKFSPYIDTTTMRPVDDRTCGRCNRLSNCGYHLPPREMPRNEDFGARRSREKRESPGPVRQKEEFGETKNNQREASEFYEKMRRACEQSQPWGSHLVTWLRTQFPRDAVAAALKRYRVGGTPDGATLWWQIDTQGRVHTGKAMQYNPLTGHRVKEQGFPVNWAHRMRLYGEPSDLVVPQCLFGEHLINVDVNADAKRASVLGLAERSALTTTEALALQRSGACDLNCHPEDIHRGAQSTLVQTSEMQASLRFLSESSQVSMTKSLTFSSSSSLALQAATPPLVMLVESEKTALIMSLVCPDHVWLATGGKQGFKEQMLAPLIGLEVAVYPDADALRDWYARIVEMNRTLGTRLHIPTWYYNLMDHPEAIARGLDLADILMEGGGLSIGAIDTIDAIVPIDAIGSIDAIDSQP